MRKKVFLLVFLAVVLAAHPLYLPAIGRSVIANDKIDKADAIFVPAGDNAKGDRAHEAIKLYKKGFAKKLLLSGDNIAWRTNSADIMEKQALYYSVPKKDIIKIEHTADSTLEEARIILKAVKRHEIKSVILVTSNYHSKRAKRAVSKGFGNQIKVFVHAANDRQFYPDPDNWWKSRRQAKTLLQELIKTAWSYTEK